MRHFKPRPSQEAVIGTSWWGHTVFESYHDLVEKIGVPHTTWDPGDKVQYEWVFSDEDGRCITLYDWKEGDNRHPSEWHVGSRDRETASDFVAWFKETHQDVNRS